MHKRTSVPLSRARWLMPLAALLSVGSLGCPGQELAPLGPCTVSAVTERVDQAGVSDVDLLFVIDNSGSMASEQQKIAAQLPRLVEVLTSGDRCPGAPEDASEEECEFSNTTDPKRKFTAVKQLHLGVVSSNMGGIDAPEPRYGAAVGSCKGLGDDGKLLNSTALAVSGVTVDVRSEFGKDYALGDVVLAPKPDCELSNQPKYQEFVAADGDKPGEVAQKFACVASVGVRGCPFEQQLEAAWKALAPEEGAADDKSVYEFLNGTSGHGDGSNAGFLREDAILAIVQVSDEEDCSITDAGKVMFAQTQAATTEYGEINLRCGQNADREDLIHPTSRYVDGLKSLKPDNPDRIIFAAIVGVPPEAIEAGDSIEDILELPAMQFGVNPVRPGFPRTSCTGMTDGKIDEAYPPRRFLEVAKEFGEQAVIYSICEDDYTPALDSLIGKIASKLKGNCLPRKLNPDEKGKVSCEVFELLNTTDTKCVADRGHIGDVQKRPIRENGKIVQKRACRMNQVPVVAGADGPAPRANVQGWYYDNFSPDLQMDCLVGEQQRIAFQFKGAGGNDLPSGAGATFECFQPVARIDNNARGFDAVNTSCKEGGDDTCSARNDKEANGYKLQCIPSSQTCQIKCQVNPDCPPGWVCAAGVDKKPYCQLPTCPQDASGGGSGDE